MCWRLGGLLIALLINSEPLGMLDLRRSCAIDVQDPKECLPSSSSLLLLPGCHEVSSLLPHTIPPWCLVLLCTQAVGPTSNGKKPLRLENKPFFFLTMLFQIFCFSVKKNSCSIWWEMFFHCELLDLKGKQSYNTEGTWIPEQHHKKLPAPKGICKRVGMSKK